MSIEYDNSKNANLCESRVKQAQYFALNSLEDTVKELTDYCWLIWGDAWNPESKRTFDLILAMNKYLSDSPCTEELFVES
jgi:hypothetical protein